ncbi:MAG: PqqD family protein [Aridibacter sp.]
MNKSNKPKARTHELVINKLPDELLVYDLKNHKAFCLNNTAAAIWNICDGKKSVAELAEQLGAKLKVGKKATNSDLETVTLLAVKQLAEMQLLEVKHRAEQYTQNTENFSRRDLIGRLGAGAVIALPIITAIAAPKAAQAASGTAQIGDPCTLDSDCVTNCCEANVCGDPAAGACFVI